MNRYSYGLRAPIIGTHTERLGEVRFVPLVGEHAWEPAEPEAGSRHDEGDDRQTASDT